MGRNEARLEFGAFHIYIFRLDYCTPFRDGGRERGVVGLAAIGYET